MPPRTKRVEYTNEDDQNLTEYLAKYCQGTEGYPRRGRKVYDILVANEQNLWPWSDRHPSQSWRERYVKHAEFFDPKILKIQRPPKKRKKTGDPTSPEVTVKRVKLHSRAEEEEESSTSESRTQQATAAQRASSSSKQTSKPTKRPDVQPSSQPPSTSANIDANIASTSSRSNHESDVRPSSQPPSTSANIDASVTSSSSWPKHPRESNVRPSSSPTSANIDEIILDLTSSSSKPASKPTKQSEVLASSSQHPSTNTNADTTIPNLTFPETLEIPIPSSSLNQQAPPASDEPRPAKHIKKRPRVPSELFASLSPPPRKDPASANGGGPLSETLPAPSAPNSRTDGVPLSTNTYPRAPPRLVDSFHGQVLVDKKGSVPRAFAQNRIDEESGERTQWPPRRGHTAKQRRASGLDTEVDTHHAFSQHPSLPQPPQPARNEAVQGTVEDSHKKLPSDRHAIAAQFSGKASREVPQLESEDTVRNGASPIKRIIPPAPDVHPKASSEISKFPVPCTSTESPFRPESPTERVRHPHPQPRPRQLSRTRAARHPELARNRRRTMESGKRSDKAVPSLDLLELSRSSMSARSRSHSATGAAKALRRSVLAITPRVLEERPRLGSGSPFRWPSSNGLAQSTPLYMSTPSPVRFSTSGAGLPTSPEPELSPFPSDHSVTSKQGLTTILARMAANHNLGFEVAKRVYKGAKSLKRTDDVLRQMTGVAEGFGQRILEKWTREERERLEWEGSERRNGARREEKGGLRYVIGSEDGESDYSPPETSRAAMWKRRHAKGIGNAQEDEMDATDQQDEEVDEEDEEEDTADAQDDDADDDEGRAVEEELWDGDDEDDDVHHDFSFEKRNNQVAGEDEHHDGARDNEGEERMVGQALTEPIPAQELEKRVGREQFRRDIVKRFI